MSEHPPSTRVRNASWARCLAVAIVSVAISPVTHAQDFSDFFSYNGSFESGSSPPPLSFPSSHSTNTTVTGWRVYAGGVYPQWLKDINAQDGSRYIRLRSTGGAGAGDSGVAIDGYSISPTPFTVGEIYELSFWAAGGPTANNNLDVLIGSSVGVSHTTIAVPTYTQSEFDGLSGLEWNQHTVAFTATDSTIALVVTSPQSTQGGYQSIVYLDNFSITQVPEPGSAVLACAGGLMLMACRRRRQCPGGLLMPGQTFRFTNGPTQGARRGRAWAAGCRGRGGDVEVDRG